MNKYASISSFGYQSTVLLKLYDLLLQLRQNSPNIQKRIKTPIFKQDCSMKNCMLILIFGDGDHSFSITAFGLSRIIFFTNAI